MVIGVKRALVDDDDAAAAATYKRLSRPRRETLTTVIVIARKSDRVKKSVLEELVKNAERLYQFIIKYVHPKLHQDCSNGCDHAEFLPIVLNKCPSNYNIGARTTRQEISALRRKLDILEASPEAHDSRVIIGIFSADGFFTNVDGAYEFFRVYLNVNITFMVYEGNNKYSLHPMNKLLVAIEDVKYHKLDLKNPEQLLVLRMISISLVKELMAQGIRDLRRLLPQQRNLSDIDLTRDPAEVDQATSPINNVIIMPNKPSEIRRYGISRDDANMHICPTQACGVKTASLEDLISHIKDHCGVEKKCVLCPNNVKKNYFGINEFRDHLRRHLPPTFWCDEIGCMKTFFTSHDWSQHMESHANSNSVSCTLCGRQISKQFLEEHQSRYCAEGSRINDTAFQCGVCNEMFPARDQLYRHWRKVHKQGDEVMGIAEDAGLLAAGVPGLGRDVTAVVQASIQQRLDNEADGKRDPTEPVLSILPQAKKGGLRPSDPSPLSE